MLAPERCARRRRARFDAAGASILRWQMAEYCSDCLSLAPGGDPLESEDWRVLVTREGEYLGAVCVGAVCAGCIADEELALIELEERYELAA